MLVFKGALPLPHLGAFGLGTERWRVTPLKRSCSQTVLP